MKKCFSIKTLAIALFQIHFRHLFAQDGCSCYNRLSANYESVASTCCSLGADSCNYNSKREVACFKDEEMCPRVLRKNSAGHFISGSMSWRSVDRTIVEFEIMSTWRMSFSWPYMAPVSKYTGPCGYPGLGDIVPIVGTLTSKKPIVGNPQDNLNSAQTQFGSAVLQLKSGKIRSHSRFIHILLASIF